MWPFRKKRAAIGPSAEEIKKQEEERKALFTEYVKKRAELQDGVASLSRTPFSENIVFKMLLRVAKKEVLCLFKRIEERFLDEEFPSLVNSFLDRSPDGTITILTGAPVPGNPDPVLRSILSRPRVFCLLLPRMEGKFPPEFMIADGRSFWFKDTEKDGALYAFGDPETGFPLEQTFFLWKDHCTKRE